VMGLDRSGAQHSRAYRNDSPIHLAIYEDLFRLARGIGHSANPNASS
jgi:hypothetical protein